MNNYQINVPVFSLPKPIAELGELAYNLWWSWNPEALRLYRRIDPVLWERVEHNPVRFLQQVARKNLNAAAQDGAYLEAYRRVMSAFNTYIDADTTWSRTTFPQSTATRSPIFPPNSACTKRCPCMRAAWAF